MSERESAYEVVALLRSDDQLRSEFAQLLAGGQIDQILTRLEGNGLQVNDEALKLAFDATYILDRIMKS